MNTSDQKFVRHLARSTWARAGWPDWTLRPLEIAAWVSLFAARMVFTFIAGVRRGYRRATPPAARKESVTVR